MNIKWGRGTHREIRRVFQWRHWNKRNQQFLMEIVNDYLKSHIPEGMTRRTVRTVEPNKQEKSEQIYIFRYSSTTWEITENYSDLLGPLPLKLPPFCEVSHEIPLIDESKQLKHRLPKCPEAFHSELARKIEWYTTTGWWVPAAAKQVTPILCIPKKNGTLRTMFDLRQQKENTWKDVTPFPDQDAIHHDIAWAKFRSKLDMTEAYE